MAVSDIERRSDIYLGNGVTTEFAYPFKIFAASDLEVRQIDADDVTTVLILDTDYTVSGVEAANGGVVTLTTPVPTGERLLIIGSQPFDQPLVLVNQGPYFATDVMRALDRCVILAQQLNERLGRAVVLPPQAAVADLDTLIEGILALEAISSEIATVAGAIANVNAVGDNIADVNTVAGSNTAITNLAAIDDALANLDAIRTQLLAVEANSDDISAVAAVNAAVSAVAGIEAAVVAVAAIAASVAAVADIDDAVVSIAQKYQGAAATNPTVRALDGSALEVGDFYLNTVTDDIRFVTSVGPVVWSELTTLIDESTLTSLGLTAPASAYNAAAALSGRNLIINGSGRINQRAYVSGAATSGANQFTLDRWFVVTSGQNLSWTGDDSRRVMTAPAGGVRQVVEGVNIVGGDYVLNWDGTATATVNGVARTKGEVFTLTANTNVVVAFTSGTFTDVQLERGSIVTPFEWRPVGQELALCQRYWCQARGNARFTATAATQFVDVSVYWPVDMRAAPSVTQAGGNVTNAIPTLNDVEQSGLRFSIQSVAAGACLAISRVITADAELTS